MTLEAPIEGYAARYGEPDMNGDVIAPGAFARSISRRGVVRMLYQHQAETPIGRWRRFEERSSGLYAYGSILLAAPRQEEVAALVRARVIDGLSIGFQTVRASKTTGGRRILEADLWEVSVVTFPMAEKARIRRVGEPVAPDRRPREGSLAGLMREAASLVSA